MKKQLYLSIFLVFFLISKRTVFGQGIGQYTDQISKLGGELPNQEVLKIIDNLYQQKVINEKGRNQFKLLVEKRTLPEIIKKKEGDEASKIDRVKMFAPILLGKDSTKMNRNVILAILGFVDLLNMEDKITKSNSVKGGELNSILGEKWNFKPVIEGDNDNPLSLKIDMDKNRENYTSLLEGINNSGLLDTKVYADAKKWLEKKDLFILKDFSILLYATVRSVYYDSYEMLKTSQSKAIDSLALAGVIQKAELQNLKQKITDYKLLTKTEIFKKNKTNFSLNSNELDFQNKEVVLRKLFEKIDVLIPTLKISDLKFETLEVEGRSVSNPMAQAALSQIEKYIDSKKLVVSANFNGKNYIKEVDFVQMNDEMIPDSEMKSTISKLLNSAWLGKKDVQIFNDFLMDAGSKNRIYVVGDEFSVFPKSNSVEKVVFLMDSVQNAIAAKQMPLMRISLGGAQDFEGINSLKNLRTIYANLLSTKLIEPTTDQKVENIFLKSRQKQNDSDVKREIVFNLLNEKPNFFVKGDIFKKEGLNPSFEKFINQLASSSNGAFKPEAIQSNFEEELSSKVDTDTYNFTFGFTSNGTPYTETIVLVPLTEDEENINKMLGNNRFSKIENKILALAKTASTSHKPYLFNQNGAKYLFLKEEEVADLNEKLTYVFEEIVDEANRNTAYIDSTSADDENSDYKFDAEVFITELQEANMIDDEGIEKLRAKYPETLPDYNLQFFPFLKNGVTFDVLPNLKQSNEAFFKNLYETARTKFLPELKLEKFSVKLDSTRYSDGENTNFDYFTKVSYTINGQNYHDEFSDFENFKASILAQIEEQTIAEDSISLESFFVPFSAFNNYLADVENEKRIISSVQGNKVYFQFLNNEQYTKMDGYSFGDATLKNMKIEIEKLIELKLIDKVSADKIEELVNKYRAKESTFYINNFLDLIRPQQVQPFVIINAENKIVWHEAIAKVSKNAVSLKNYSDNYAQLVEKINVEIQKENEEDKIEKFELKSSFMLNNVKIEGKIELNRNENYYVDASMINENYLKRINTELEKAKNPNRFYIDSYHIFYINDAQKVYLTDKSVGFFE